MLTTDLTIKLSEKEYALAIECQNNYEKIYEKRLSLEELFKQSLFFNTNTLNQKIRILKDYKTIPKKTETEQATFKEKGV